VPQVSVVIPAYRPTGFDGLRASIAANADADAEWIVIDDGSGAYYDAVFATLSDTPVRVIRHARNRRQGAARNAGLAQASAAWVKFLDADDQLDEGHLAMLLAAAQSGPSRAIPFALTRHVFPSGATWVNDSSSDLVADPNMQLARLLCAPFLHHCGALFPRDFLTDLGGYDESLVTDEDGDLLIRALMSGAHFEPVPSVQYHYIHHSGDSRVSFDAGGAKLAARLRVCEKVEAAFERRSEHMPHSVRHALALRLDKIALTWWNEDRVAARAVLCRAQNLCPGYQPGGRLYLRLLRTLGGPSAAKVAAKIYRRIRGRPIGGAQG
jgi:glycosyltransferase involved in cell wall biosynthesis